MVNVNRVIYQQIISKRRLRELYIITMSEMFEIYRTSIKRSETSSAIAEKQRISSSVRHRLLVSWHLQKISQDLLVFTVILEYRTAN